MLRITRSSWLHLRIPFSFFLMPVFLFALSTSKNIHWTNTILAFISIHLFLYPASNGYNSYFDKDEQSIGGLKTPPPVSKNLYFVALLFDAITLCIGITIGYQFTLLLLIYGFISKAYSHPLIRLKKYPWLSWLTIGFFQGFFVFMMSYIAINNINFQEFFSTKQNLYAATLTTLLLLGSYPMTQIYQHKEDKKRGDITLSIILGIKGTFHFTGILFLIASSAFFLYYIQYNQLQNAVIFILFLTPVIFFFATWYRKVLLDEKKANFTHTMALNLLSSSCLIIYFIYIIISNHR